MITRIEINGFKTFENFSMGFSPFVVVAGTNASGKSNLFDSIRLMSALAESDLRTAFSDQRGSFLELFTQFSSVKIASKIRIGVDLFLDTYVEDDFNNMVELGHRRLRYEIEVERKKDKKLGIEKLVVNYEALSPIKRSKDKWFKEVVAGTKWEPARQSRNFKPYIKTEMKGKVKVISLRQDGIRGGKPTPIKDLERTVLSGINDASFPHAYAVRSEMLNWNVLQLSPIELSKPSPMLGHDTLDIEGRNLAGLIHRIYSTEPMALSSMSRMIHKILPEIRKISIEVDSIRRQYVLMAEGEDERKFSSNVLSEGTLRIIALIALIHDERHRGLICFEEPENGIHPYRMRKILEVLQKLATDFQEEEDFELPLRQVLINTHSPLLIQEVRKLSFQNCLIYFSRLTTKVDAQKKLTYRLTRISPVIPKNTKRMFLESIPAEDSVTDHELTEYLNSFDSTGVKQI